jgi:hypothetical protein
MLKIKKIKKKIKKEFNLEEVPILFLTIIWRVSVMKKTIMN